MRSNPGEWITMRRDRVMSSVTALLYGGGAALLATSVLLWSPGKNPRWVLATLALVAAAFCAQALWRGPAFTRAECLGMLLVLQAVVGALTWTTPSSMAAFSNGSVLPLVAVYASWFLTPHQARLASYGGVAWWVLAVLQRQDPLLTGLCLSVVLQTAAAVEVFSRIKVRLETMARTDALTGALNRWGVQDVVGRQILRGGRRPFSVALLDIDDLRAVNTSGGHRAGDALLADVVRHLEAGLRTADSVGRLGGDEFLLVLPGLDRGDAERVVERLAQGSPASWSAGVTTWRPGDDIAALVDRADGRMYAVKSSRVA